MAAKVTVTGKPNRPHKQSGQRKKVLIYSACILAPVMLFLVSLFIGKYDLNLGQVLDILKAGYGNAADAKATVIWEVRMPRAIVAILVGGALAVSGGALQGIFRNPLVDSGILGVSAGAGFGACLAIILFQNTGAIYLSAFGFALLAVFLSTFTGRIYQNSTNISIVLGGVIISSIFTSLIAFTKYLADPYRELPAITFWLMGSLATVDYQDLLFCLVPISVGVIGIMLMRWKINVISIGDKEARSLGVNVDSYRFLVIVFTALATAGAVCVSGTIGWIGLIIPHIARMLLGNDNRKILPISFSLGACFLLIVDDLARLLTGGEMPIGILTSLIGGPFYIYLLKKTNGGNWTK